VRLQNNPGLLCLGLLACMRGRCVHACLVGCLLPVQHHHLGQIHHTLAKSNCCSGECDDGVNCASAFLPVISCRHLLCILIGISKGLVIKRVESMPMTCSLVCLLLAFGIFQLITFGGCDRASCILINFFFPLSWKMDHILHIDLYAVWSPKIAAVMHSCTACS
jgi:ribose/xylose/arabinose/galactoside ABC-type transport system permease subunit